MLLLCKECHWSTLVDDDEVTLKGGPRAFRCGACQSTLDTMGAALGVQELSTASEAADMMSGARHTGPILTTNEISGSTLADVDGQNIIQNSASAKEYLAKLHARQTQQSDATDQVEAYSAPPGQVIIGQSTVAASRKATEHSLTQPPPSTAPGAVGDPDATQQEVSAAAMVQGAMAIAGPQRSHRTDSLPVLSPAMSTSINAQAHVAARAPAPAPKRAAGRGMGLMLGCAALLLMGFLGAGGVGVALYFSSGEESLEEDKGDKEGVNAKGDDLPSKKKRPPERPPLGERIHEMVRAHSGTSVPTIHLPGRLPNEAEAILMTPNGVVYNDEMTATVSVGRVAADARPTDESPFITPLARKLEATYQERIRDAIDAEAEPRWVVAVGDSTVPYTVVYSTLYTAWERGARLQVAATNPNNPSAYVSIDVLPHMWPAPIKAAVPDDLPVQNPAVDATPADAGLIVVEINDKGFTLKPPGDEEPLMIEKVTTWPVQRLRKEIRAQREAHGDIRTLVIRPREKTKLFTLLQTIGALVGPWKETAKIDEVRLARPGQ